MYKEKMTPTKDTNPQVPEHRDACDIVEETEKGVINAEVSSEMNDMICISECSQSIPVKKIKSTGQTFYLVI